jgi:hypothetical protein
MTNSSTKPPVWFWVIGVIALLWNLMGVNAYLQQAYRTEAFTSMLTSEQLDLVNSTPAWAIGAFAIAVFAGALGCIALLLRKNWAKSLFLLSLIGIIVQMIYNLFISKAMEVYGPGAVVMPILVMLVGIFLVWYSKRSIIKGWID